MTRRAGLALAALAVTLVACGGGAASTSTVTASTWCADCRTLGVGRDPRLGAAAVGVRRCDVAACALSIRAADGSVTRPTVRAGDTFRADGRWLVVRTDGTGLVVRPA